VLRIDDTHAERSSLESVSAILDAFRWLGLDWDEGPDVGGPHAPYFQGQRHDLYRQKAEKLLSEGKAYECFCTQEELDAEREKCKAAGKPMIYNGRCRDLADADRERLREEGRKPTIRFRMTGDRVRVRDHVKGDREIKLATIGDFPIVRPNGASMYNFASVIDDIEMKITHVIRADEHWANMGRQLPLFHALGAELPEFAHVSMVLGEGRKGKLSKRTGAQSIQEFRSLGYLPEALLNYLVRLGWSYDDKREIIGVDELREAFDLDRITGSAAGWDNKKLEWLNSRYVAALPVSDRVEAVKPFLQQRGLLGEEVTAEQQAHLERVVEAVGDRLRTLAEIVDQADFFFAEEVVFDEKAVCKRLAKPEAPALLEGAADMLAGTDPFEAARLEEAVRAFAEERGVSASAVIHPIRVALTGKTAGPGLFDVIEIVGRESAVARLRAAVPVARDAAAQRAAAQGEA
jgi:glutamyl-tRNA synthetase